MSARVHRFAVVCVASCLVAAAFATSAGAQQSYIGGTYCWTNLDVSGGTGSNPTGAGFKLFIGRDSPRLFGLELGYTDFGQFKKAASAAGESAAYTFNAKGWDLALTLQIPLSRVFGLYGKIGYLWWRSDLSAAIGDLVSGNDSGGSVFYNAGLRVNLSRSISLLAEWERDTLGSDFTVDMVNAGLRFNF